MYLVLLYWICPKNLHFLPCTHLQQYYFQRILWISTRYRDYPKRKLSKSLPKNLNLFQKKFNCYSTYSLNRIVLVKINYIASIKYWIKINGIMLPSFQHSTWIFIESSNQCNMSGTRFRRYSCVCHTMDTFLQNNIT